MSTPSAVIITGGKQYRICPGQTFCCEKLEVEPSEEVVFDKVLLVTEGEQIKIGEPYVEGARVRAKVVEQLRGSKIEVIKFRRRKHYMRRQGHRQYLTKFEVTSIES